MTKNDHKLLGQMIAAGRFNYGIYQLLVEHNKQRAKEMIEEMGPKWCLHKDHSAKRLEVPMQILDGHRFDSHILANFKKGRSK